MDVEKLQKVNSLARDYVKHGMATSMDEAVRMAEEKIKGQSNMDFIRGDEPKAHPQGAAPAPAASTATPSQSVPAQSTPQPAATEQSILKELTHIVEAQSTQIEQMTTKINAIIKELNELKEKVSKPTSVPQAASPQQEVQTQFKAPAQPTAQPATPDKKSNPRSGNYKPEDVSVENVFYSGTGR